MYLDGDVELPTLIGTGTEDYIGTAWGQGKFNHQYTGCLLADRENDFWTFYRFHVPDPIYFKNEILFEIQAMGGNQMEKVVEFIKNGVPLIPVSVQQGSNFKGLMDSIPSVDLANDKIMSGWTNFYRQDDWSSTAYFYLDKAENNLSTLADVKIRTYKLKTNN